MILNMRRTREKKKSESQMGFELTTLRDLVGCSNHLSYWRLYGEQGPICGSRLEPHHAATQRSRRSRRVVGSNPIWDSDFFFFRVLLKLISCCCCFIFNIFFSSQLSLCFYPETERKCTLK